MAKAQKTLINGVAYSYVDLSISFEGTTVAAYADGFKGIPIQSIDYSSTQQKTANYENSKYPTSYSYGKVEFTGSVTFTLDSIEFLRDRIFELTAESRSILDLPTGDLTLTYANRGKANIHTLKNVAFTTENTSGSEGDDTFAVSCDFIASFIQYGDPTNVKFIAIAAVKEIAGSDNQITPPTV
jgi:hypothetical protein